MNKYLLFTPGPTNIHKNVVSSFTNVTIGHREPEFIELLHRTEFKLFNLLEINKVDEYRAVFITGSGTAANEAMLSSMGGDKKILILSNGEFGERLYNISTLYNTNTKILRFKWAEPLAIEAIELFLKKEKIDVLAMVHHETSTGMLNPLKEIAAIAKKYNLQLIIDGISSIGAEKLDFERDHIAFCSGSSSKALASYPGLSFIVGRKANFERLKSVTQKSNYLNLYNFYKVMKLKQQTPNTPAIQLIFALEKAIDNILSGGIEKHYLELNEKSELIRKSMHQLGFKQLLKPSSMMSKVLTTFQIPEKIGTENFHNTLRHNNIIIYKGKGMLVDKVCQIANIGDLSFKDIEYLLKVVKNNFVT